MKWQQLPAISAPMSFQMALDEILFRSQKEKPQDPVLRFYVSSEPWISAGYSFRDDDDLRKSDLIRKNPGVPVCRRITGGGCVNHGDDLIFSLTGRIQTDPENFNSVRMSYQKIHEAVKAGLEPFGFHVTCYGEEDELPKGSDCFDFPVESDLAWKGKKIAGGAQKRSEGVFLHHESVLIPSGISREELMRSIRSGLEKVFAVSIKTVEMDPALYFQAEKSPWKNRQVI
ncbi:MAG TPA: hypothetical protein P5561_04310 [Candidatus Omnitrophota bacterium]|nr:hypothetical protein [Candidatus Omnitrophota bacterium]HRY85734.1 hypothetical protein [Candidatus Omnitrophota bacterium]